MKNHLKNHILFHADLRTDNVAKNKNEIFWVDLICGKCSTVFFSILLILIKFCGRKTCFRDVYNNFEINLNF
jgi:hypothetical protein